MDSQRCATAFVLFLDSSTFVYGTDPRCQKAVPTRGVGSNILRVLDAEDLQRGRCEYHSNPQLCRCLLLVWICINRNRHRRYSSFDMSNTIMSVHSSRGMPCKALGHHQTHQQSVMYFSVSSPLYNRYIRRMASGEIQIGLAMVIHNLLVLLVWCEVRTDAESVTGIFAMNRSHSRTEYKGVQGIRVVLPSSTITSLNTIAFPTSWSLFVTYPCKYPPAGTPISKLDPLLAKPMGFRGAFSTCDRLCQLCDPWRPICWLARPSSCFLQTRRLVVIVSVLVVD